LRRRLGLSIAAVGNPRIFDPLLEFGANIYLNFLIGESSLSLAVHELGHREISFNICKLFLESGAHPNIILEIGQALLHVAALWKAAIVGTL